jgi:hypothetical protein
MTQTTFIIISAVLGAVVVQAVLTLLAHGIHSDRRARQQRADIHRLGYRERDDLAA